MALLQSSLRFARLELSAAIFALGPAPWLLFIAWMLVATLQEPTLLRHHGILVVWDAAYAGWSLILLQMLHARPRLYFPASQLGLASSSACLVATCALALALTLGLADGLRGLPTSSSALLSSSLAFGLAWAPLAVSYPRSRERLVRNVVPLFCLWIGAAVSVRLHHTAPSPDVLVASLAAMVVSVVSSRI
jgi:hypothetical protein